MASLKSNIVLDWFDGTTGAKLTGSANNMTGTNVLVTNSIPMGNAEEAAMEISWTGTPTGTFSLQVSVSGANWADTGVTIAAAAGAADFRIISASKVAFNHMRLKYTNTVGAGTMVAGAALTKDIN